VTRRDLPSRIAEFLRQRRAPASSLLLADRFLKLSPADEDLATRLLRPILAPLGFTYTAGLGWEPEGPPAGVPAAVRQVACAVETAGGRLRGVALVEAGGEAARRVDGLDWIAIGEILGGAKAVFLAPEVESPVLLAEMSRRGLPLPAAIRSLSAAVRGAVRLRRGSGLEAICHALGCAFREGGSPADAAANVAACLEAAVRRRVPGPPGPPLPPPRALSEEALDRVPNGPGVYRFYDAGGSLLYVGKAADLRRRLGGHARAIARGRAPGLAGVDHVEWEVAGSELEALLEEARQIAARAPAVNVQREVHERGRAYGPGRRWALLLPSARQAAVAVVFVREGAYAGSCRIGPRGGGLPRASRLLEQIFVSTPPRRERDTEILNSWLARHAERVPRLDLDSFRSPAEALQALREAVASLPHAEPDPFLRRSR
jgi:hypothetical protein